MTSKRYSRRRYDVLGELRREREAQKLLRKTLAHRTGFHLATLGRWERGETMPALPALVVWAKALGMKITARPL